MFKLINLFSYLMPQCLYRGTRVSFGHFTGFVPSRRYNIACCLNVTVLLDASISLAKPTLMVYLTLRMLAVVIQYSLWRFVGLDASIMNWKSPEVTNAYLKQILCNEREREEERERKTDKVLILLEFFVLSRTIFNTNSPQSLGVGTCNFLFIVIALYTCRMHPRAIQ